MSTFFTVSLIVLSIIAGIFGVSLDKQTRYQRTFYRRLDWRGKALIITLIISGFVAFGNEYYHNVKDDKQQEKDSITLVRSLKESENNIHNDFKKQLLTIGFKQSNDSLIPLTKFAALYSDAMKSAENNTFSINFLQPELLSFIKRHNKLSYSPRSKLNVIITYSGKIEQLSNNLYYYSGGKIVVKIPNAQVESFSNIELPRSYPGGNDYNVVVESLQTEITRELNKHSIEIAKIVSKCLE